MRVTFISISVTYSIVSAKSKPKSTSDIFFWDHCTLSVIHRISWIPNFWNSKKKVHCFSASTDENFQMYGLKITISSRKYDHMIFCGKYDHSGSSDLIYESFYISIYSNMYVYPIYIYAIYIQGVPKRLKCSLILNLWEISGNMNCRAVQNKVWNKTTLQKLLRINF